jgi:hypothetical protein
MEIHLEVLLELIFCTQPPNFEVEAHIEAPTGVSLSHLVVDLPSWCLVSYSCLLISGLNVVADVLSSYSWLPGYVIYARLKNSKSMYIENSNIANCVLLSFDFEM